MIKLLVNSSILATLTLLLSPRIVVATHASGGENDLMGAYGGVALVLGFAGLLGMLGLVPRGWQARGLRWGKWLLAAGVAVLLAGGFHTASLGTVEETLGGVAWGRAATQQLLGTLAVFGGFSGAVYYLGKRSGILDMGERVKYSVMRNGDPMEKSAYRVARPGEQRLMLIPLAAMGVLAAFLTVGVLIVLVRLS